MTLRATKMERTRDLIAETALTLFQEQGYADTTVEQIAAAAEVGARTVYRYYPTKEALVFGLYARMLDTARQELRALPDDTSVPDLLRAVLDSIVRSHLDKPDQMLAAFALAQQTRSVMAYLTHLLFTWRQELVHDVAARLDGRSADLVAGLAVEQTATVFTLAFRKWADGGGRSDLRKLTYTTLKLLHSDAVPLPSLRR
ncbi:TetR/AcrR family transcriptional regulator [Amycolatopsis suaedae]|uniref:TetR family transcriptional regulator n=1 Tax=Amycolatopsis suaedae TaxID=2510978 RepID=A0A4Q7J564_9PSEU|nr:TetR/AcrR family transcriptional regulator [Amycolatopsis suaedae]RZQ61443.1 TetR family transcriptional regulator [Amycolatopsis suaedae]